MLLAVDIGNTNITLGLFKGGRLVKTWRCVTIKVGRLAGLQVGRLAGLQVGRLAGLQVGRLKGIKVGGVIASSVVPEIDGALKKVFRKRFGIKPVFVDYKNAGVRIGYPRPKEIGADRLANAAMARHKYKSACVIIDFGTATTLDYIDKKGVYWGGSIAPGINLANKALYLAASKLPMAKVTVSNRMIPKTTVGAIQTGVYQGYIGLIEHLIKKTVASVGGRPKVILTGGLAPIIMKGMRIKGIHEPNLTLEGLRLIYERDSEVS